MNIASRIRLAGDALFALLDPEHDLMPTGGYETAHDLGRWWDAVLRIEETIGLAIPPELEAASLRNLSRLTDNPDALLMNRTDISWMRERARINPHNFRETLLAFGGLVTYRNSRWAQESVARLVASIDRVLLADGRLDFQSLGSWGTLPLTDDPSHTEIERGRWFDATATSGRCLEALVWLHEATHDAQTLDVAARIAEHHLLASLAPDHSIRREIIDPQNVGHNHSYHGTLRGLLRFGLLTGDRRYVDAVARTYRSTRGVLVKQSGWAPHDLGKTRFANRAGDPVADPASAGDAAQIALWLALEAGHDDLLDDVERIVRARLVPAQMTADDGEARARELGAWCIHGPSHGGKGCTPDVLAAVAHTLCDVQRNSRTATAAGTRINLHFDSDDDGVTVRCRRERNAPPGTPEAEVAVTVHVPLGLRIRIPQWTPDASVKLRVDGREVKLRRDRTWAVVDAPALRRGSRVVMTFALPEKQTEERMPSGRVYRFRWLGDRIAAASPTDEPRPFYPPLDQYST